jgi:TRAP-type C4-dicarboxylate transport system substrate-binding protein
VITLKRRFVISLVLVCFVVVGIIGTGCTAKNENASGTQNSESQKVYRWRYQIWDPSLNEIGAQSQLEMCERIKERSNGRLIIDVHVSGSLGYNGFDHHKVTSDGLIEMGEVLIPAMAELPEFALFTNLMYFKNLQDVYTAADAVMPELKNAMENKWNLVMLGLSGRPADILHSTKRPFSTLDSMKGAKIRSFSSMSTLWLEEIGAVAVVTPASEIYTALATGVVEGNFASPITHIDRKQYEVCQYTNLWPVSPVLHAVFVNRDAFNSLPSDLQEILVEEVQKERANIREKTINSDKPALEKLQNEHGVTIVEISEEELTKGREAGARVLNKWLAEQPERVSEMLNKIEEILGY